MDLRLVEGTRLAGTRLFLNRCRADMGATGPAGKVYADKGRPKE